MAEPAKVAGSGKGRVESGWFCRQFLEMYLDSIADRTARMRERLAGAMTAPIIEGKRARNQASWAQKENWMFGFYFGHDDTRLWVPKRIRNGEPSEERCIINFGHPMGRSAFRILMLAYAVGVLAAGVLLAALMGVRW